MLWIAWVTYAYIYPKDTEQFIQERNWQRISVEQVWDMPNVFIGTIDFIMDEMFAQREKYGFSYYWVPDKQMDDFVRILERMTGK